MTKAELEEQVKELEDIRQGQNVTIRKLKDQIDIQAETLKGVRALQEITERELQTANEALDANNKYTDIVKADLEINQRLLRIIKATVIHFPMGT